MSDGVISIDVELNEKEFQTVLANMGVIIQNGSENMIQSIDNLGRNFAILPNNIDTAFKSVPSLVNGVINSISSQNSAMAEAGSNLFNSLADNIPKVTENIANRMPEINNSIVDTLASFSPNISSAGFDLFTSLTDELPNAITEMIEKVPQISLGISDRINEDRELMAGAGFDLFASLTDELPSVIEGMIEEEIPQISLGISDRINEDRELMASVGFDLFTSLADNLTGAIEIISQAPHLIVETIIGVFTGLLFRFNDIGKNIVQGVWAGISSMASWLASQVSGFFQGIISGITGFLGIQSPSTLFRDKIGKNIALGVGAGIAEEMPNVADDMLKYINAVVVSAERGASKININGFIDSAIAQEQRGGMIKSNDLKADTDNLGSSPNVNITIEPSGDMRGFFEYLSMNIKRADYLSGGAGV